VLVPVAESLALAGTEAVVRDAGECGAEVGCREA
jgi:hypothetical protein